MKHLPKSTPTEILNDPYGFTYKEMSEVIGEDKARALYTELYKQPFHKENLSISTKKVYLTVNQYRDYLASSSCGNSRRP